MRKSKIGGQAVIEGVMMRGKTAAALSCRDEKKRIRVKTWRLSSKANIWKKIPVLRGVVNFISSMKEGVKTLMDSAEVFGDEEEPSKFELWLAKKFKIDLMQVVLGMAVILGVCLAGGLFIVLPSLLSKLAVDIFKIESYTVRLIIEACIKIIILFSYISLTSLVGDVKRVYMYHGAEHKTINCYEQELELTVDNVRGCKKFHNRCGTTFLFFVVLVSIFVSVFVRVDNEVLRILIKLALLPVVAGIAYELLMFIANSKCFLLYPLRLPGMLLQKITTSEPDDQMIEVAITSFKAVLELDENPDMAVYDDFSFKYASDVYREGKKLLGNANIAFDADIDWIICHVLNINRSQINQNTQISKEDYEKIVAIIKLRCEGRPLWYILGKTNFYGLDIKVDERVLIPRPETESLVEEVLRCVTPSSKVLDICTGTSAISLAIKKNCDCDVMASDKSCDALSLAKENSEILGLDIKYVESDMFENIEGKFDVIVSNPPYIKKGDISSLQREVKDFEPMMALDGGESGLDFYEIIAENAMKYLNDGGAVMLEVGFDQAEDVSKLLEEKSFVTEIKKDMMDVDRIVIGRNIK